MSRAAREIQDKKQALDQYKNLFRVLARVFYTDMQVVIMDYIVKSYFEKQFFMTSEVSRDTKVSEKAVRAELQEFKKAKLINSITEDQLANPEFEHIQKKVDELTVDNPFYVPTYERGYGNQNRREEIWELNKKVKDLVEDKLKIIEKKMNEEFEGYDSLLKICSSQYCRKKWKSQDYYFTNGYCPSCKSDLTDFYRQGENVNEDSADNERNKILMIINDLRNRLHDITMNEIPDPTNNNRAPGAEDGESEEQAR